MSEDMTNDPDERFTEDLLRATLGPKFNSAILDSILNAEALMIGRKDNLADLMDAGVITKREFADKVNRVLSVYLRAVSSVVGEEACRAMYDFGPDDRIQLIDPERMRPPTTGSITPEVLDAKALAAIATDERIAFRDSVLVRDNEEDFGKNLAHATEFLAIRGEAMEAGFTSRKEIACYQAAMLSVYLVDKISGEGVSQFIWRICEKIMILAGQRLRASDHATGDLCQLCRDAQIEALEDSDDIEMYTDGTQQIEEWLSDNSPAWNPALASKPPE
ncbi:MAG: hypothetical protein HQ581_09265 [Planctomycetes bacterium]|nr:hypothetical protein [Planctomycetota bacterium]